MIRTTTRIGTTESVSRPSCQSSTSSTTVMPTSSTRSPIANTEVSRNSCSACTSPCRRDIRRPTSVLSMNDSETRCRWAYIARRRSISSRSAIRADQGLLDQVGHEVEADDRRGRPARRACSSRSFSRARDQRVVDHAAQDQRDRDLARGEHQDREHGQHEAAAIGADEVPEAAHDLAVEGGEDLLLGVDLRADHRARRPLRLARRPRPRHGWARRSCLLRAARRPALCSA